MIPSIRRTMSQSGLDDRPALFHRFSTGAHRLICHGNDFESTGGRAAVTVMTRKAGKLQDTEAIRKPVSAKPLNHACVYKLGAVQRLATDILSRIEQLLHDHPTAIVSRQSGMLPREIEDRQTYFLHKIQHARDTLQELVDLLQVTSEKVDDRELISMELMVLFVLIENYRPERILESGWSPTEEVQHAIREKLESLGLDVINMRERLK